MDFLRGKISRAELIKKTVSASETTMKFKIHRFGMSPVNKQFSIQNGFTPEAWRVLYEAMLKEAQGAK